MAHGVTHRWGFGVSHGLNLERAKEEIDTTPSSLHPRSPACRSSLGLQYLQKRLSHIDANPEHKEHDSNAHKQRSNERDEQLLGQIAGEFC